MNTSKRTRMDRAKRKCLNNWIVTIGEQGGSAQADHPIAVRAFQIDLWLVDRTLKNDIGWVDVLKSLPLIATL